MNMQRSAWQHEHLPNAKESLQLYIYEGNPTSTSPQQLRFLVSKLEVGQKFESNEKVTPATEAYFGLSPL